MLALALAAVVVLGRQPVQASTSASLTIYLGTVQVRPPGGAFGAGHTGDALQEGDELETGAGAKAAVNFPDGSVMRLDSGTTVTLSGLSRTAAGGYGMLVSQSAGSTWSDVKTLIDGSSYRVKTPHAATAEVRGTELRISVAAGVVTVDTFSGSVDVRSAKRTVQVATGQSTTIAADGVAPAPAAPIAPGDRADSWTMFNLALGAAAPGTVTSLEGSGLSTGQSTAPAAVPGADGKRNLAVTVAWPGSTFCLEVDSPEGTALTHGCSSAPPLTVIAAKPPAGSTYTVTDVESQPGEQYWVIAVLTDARAPEKPGSDGSKEARPSSSESPTAPATEQKEGPQPTPASAPAPKPEPAPEPSPSPATAPSPSPSPSPSASPSPSPSSGEPPPPSPTPSPPPKVRPTPHDPDPSHVPAVGRA